MDAGKTQTVTAGGAGATNTPTLERRRWPRYPLTVTAEVTEASSLTQIQGRCSDVSAGGCYVDTLNPFPAGTIVRIVITRAGQQFEGEARVVFEQPGIGMGLAFTTVDQADRDKLQVWLAELSCADDSRPGAEAASPPETSNNGEGSVARTESERLVLRHLIDLLICKHTLNEQEGESLLRELLD